MAGGKARAADLSHYPKNASFQTLLSWHLDWGTRPKCDKARRNRRWIRANFAALIHPEGTDPEDASRSLRYWTNQGKLPAEYDVEKVARIFGELFGNDPNLKDWRADLERALERDRAAKPKGGSRGPAAAKGVSDEIGADQVAAGFADLLALARSQGLFEQAAEHGIPEAAVRVIVERLGGEGIDRADLVGWLNAWIEAAQRELSRQSNEGVAFELARLEAERRFRAGRVDDVSEPFMALLEKEKTGSKRRQLRLAQEAIRFDLLLMNIPQAAAKVKMAVSIHDLATREEIGDFLAAEADAFCDNGCQFGDNAALLLSLQLYEEALRLRPSDPITVRSNLATALTMLGEREAGTDRLMEAIATYRSILGELNREREPLDWGMVQSNLGMALSRMSGREGGTKFLQEAAAAYRLALEERRRDVAPHKWAITQNNLGAALLGLGERESGTETLYEALAAFRDAREVQTREADPHAWAISLCNSGEAMLILGERLDGTALLEEAIAAFQSALEELPRQRFPPDWAAAQRNLGDALRVLGDRAKSPSLWREAIVCLKLALQEDRRDRVPLHWATTQSSLGNALLSLAVEGDDAALLHEARAVFELALEEQTRERLPIEWAMGQNSLGVALLELGRRENRTDLLEDAVRAQRLALEELSRERVPMKWALAQDCLGSALRHLGERLGDARLLNDSVAAHCSALDELTLAPGAYWRDLAQRNLDDVLGTLRELQGTEL